MPHRSSTCPPVDNRQKWAQIDWPVILVTSVFSLLVTATLTSIAYYSTLPVIPRKGLLARVRSSEGSAASVVATVQKSPTAPFVAAQSENPLSHASAAHQQSSEKVTQEKKTEEAFLQTPNEPIQLAIGISHYPEENQAACELAASLSPHEGLDREDPRRAIKAQFSSVPIALEPNSGGTLPSAPQPGSSAGNCGTQVHFVKDPQAAFQQARKDKKLVFLLHVSGNFEDAKFT
jgi:hypothetical protein